jgi:23S rRNA (pseudouridine1915-N3)-methyltransferase
LKLKLICIGRLNKHFLKLGEEEYLNRLKHYISFECLQLPDIRNARNLSKEQLKDAEGKEILKRLTPTDLVILLDELGREFNSVSFATFLEKQMNYSTKAMVFIVGGAFGFSEEIYARASMKMSLSRMTYSHQMVRMIFLEQLYRAFTIIRGEPYHHGE